MRPQSLSGCALTAGSVLCSQVGLAGGLSDSIFFISDLPSGDLG